MAHDIRIVTEAELRGAVALDLETVKVIEQAFGALSDLLEQTPRTRVAAAADTPKADEAADASLMADMDVSALVAEAASALDQPVSAAKVEADEAAPRPCDMSGLTPAPEDESL